VPPGAIVGDRAEVRDEEFHHLARVRRVRPGVEVELFDGHGRGFRGRVESIGRDRLTVLIDTELQPGGREPTLDITLYQALPASKGVMEEIIFKATELGASRVVPLVTVRSRAALLATTKGVAGKLPRWERIARDACKSSGRFVPPALTPPLALEQALAEAVETGGLRLIPAEHGASRPLDRSLPAPDAAAPVDTVSLLVGPEGGWSGDELEQALGAGFLAVTLGPRILRTATAALAALVAVQLAFGDLGAASPAE
jgi:16S rRNA (uracil1498-N3)-methyltransferase